MRILETALYAENLEETADFYEHVLGLERFAEVAGRHVFFRTQGQVLLLFRPSATCLPPGEGKLPVPPHGATGPGHLCFAASAEEIDGWMGRPPNQPPGRDRKRLRLAPGRALDLFPRPGGQFAGIRRAADLGALKGVRCGAGRGLSYHLKDPRSE